MTAEPTKWTPGPWDPPHLSDDSTTCNCRSIVEGGYAGGIATVHVDNGIPLISEGGNDCPPLEEAKANGHLIAAAPDLDEALAAVVPGIRRSHGKGDGYFSTAQVEAAEAALAKARGQS